MAYRYHSLFVDFTSRKGAQPAWLGYLTTRFFGLIVLILFLSGALGRVYLDRQTAKLGREWQKKLEFLNLLKKEAENMRLEREKYMNGNHIKEAAKKLGLKETEPGQVQIMRHQQTRGEDDRIIIALPQRDPKEVSANVN